MHVHQHAHRYLATCLHKRKQHVPWCRRPLSTGFAGLETNTIWTDIRTLRFGGKPVANVQAVLRGDPSLTPVFR